MSTIKEIRERMIPGGSIPLGMSITQHEHLMLQATRDDVAALLKVLEGVREVFRRPNGGTPAYVLLDDVEEVLETFDAEWLNSREADR